MARFINTVTGEEDGYDEGYAIGLDHRGAFDAISGRRLSNDEAKRIMRKNTRVTKARAKKNNLNKFYCAARHISNAIGQGVNDDWTRPTLEEATKHAKEMIREEELDCVAIVKIVRIVRRQTPPISVEEVN